MESKSWRWRRKASEKTVVDDGRPSLSMERNIEEDQERPGPRKCQSNISDRSSSGICDCTAKDELIRKHAKIAEQALAGQKMAEAEVAYFKQELDKSLQQGETAELKLAQLNAALKDCMQEMESLRVGQKLEVKLAEANRRTSNLSSENANLMKALLCKEKLVQDLDKGKAELEAEFGLLMGRLDSVEKENILLKYEFQVIEKENTKQTKRLEAECQQLRDLVRKRLQGPSSPSNTKRSSPRMGNWAEKTDKGTRLLVERVCTVEEENKMLKEILALSDGELQSWRIKYGQMASRVAELKAQLNELSEAENSMQLAISGLGLSNYDRFRDSESWANALLEELEQFRQDKIKNEPETDKYAIITTAIENSGNQLQQTSKELVPISVDNKSCKEEFLRPGDSWLDEILKVILQEHRVSNRNVGELLQDIRIALGYDELQKNENSNSGIHGLLTWESSDSTPTRTSALGSTSSNSISVEDNKGQDIKNASFARVKLRKHLAFDRSKSESQMEVDDSPNCHNTLAQMIAIQSNMQKENREMKEKLERVTEENVALMNQLEESKQTTESLQRELESLKEANGNIEEQVENQRLINEDLDTQYTVAKAKLNEILHKLSTLEVELEDKNNCCEELEATCLELQLQLETCRFSRKDSPCSDTDKATKKLITETIQDLASPSPDVTQSDKLLSPVTTTITTEKSSATEDKSLEVQRSTLRDCMMEEDGDPTEGLKTPTTEEKESKEEKQSVNHTEVRPLPPPPGLKVQSLEQVSTLALVSAKKPGRGFGFITKMFLRRKRGCSKMKAAPLQRNTSALMKQRDVLLVA